MFPLFGMGSIMNDLERARQDAMNQRARAMQQGIGGFTLGGQAGLAGQASAQQQAHDAMLYGMSASRIRVDPRDMIAPVREPKTIREELQRDTDKWLEDVKL